MKKRLGFVSNSSSSSFIIGVGLVTDKAAFQAKYDLKKLPYDFEVYTIDELTRNPRTDGGMVKTSSDELGNITIERIIVESFDYSEVCSPDLSECSGDDLVVVYNGGCSLDECDLWNEEWEEYDYDVDMDDFSKEEQEAFSLFFDSMVDGDATYGAGRNG